MYAITFRACDNCNDVYGPFTSFEQAEGFVQHCVIGVFMHINDKTQISNEERGTWILSLNNEPFAEIRITALHIPSSPM